ncbi:MAG: radical SAM protein [Mycobacterium sp.]|nr:radical SAM protein [Mycobacterium sp.]
MASTANETSFLWLEITGRCQLACVHCYADSGPAGTHGSMRRADWLRVMDQAARMGVRMVQFIGGEPTLHPRICRRLSSMRWVGGWRWRCFPTWCTCRRRCGGRSPCQGCRWRVPTTATTPVNMPLSRAARAWDARGRTSSRRCGAALRCGSG